MKAFLIAALLSVVVNVNADEPVEIRQFDLPTISKLGTELFRIDSYAARATDILFEQNLDLAKYPLLGWVITQQSGDVVATFVGKYENELQAVFEIRPDARKSKRFKNVEGRALTEVEHAKFKARQLATSVLEEPCAEKYNSVVLRDPEDEAWLVYMLASTNKANIVPVGGHYRVTVSLDGTQIIKTDRLSRSCLVLDADPSDLPEGASIAMLFTTHIVSSTPIETHVFLSLLHDKDFAIGTEGDVIWRVSGSEITTLKR